MDQTGKDWMRTTLLYKLLCVFKWSVVNFFVAGGHKMSAIIKAHYRDKSLGIETSDFVSFSNIRDSFREGVYRDGELYEAISYEKLDKIISYLRMGPEDCFVDLGCGKGRAVLYVSLQNIRKAVGIELKKELCDLARLNLSRFKPVAPVEFINTDAVKADLCAGTVFFLYNPFGPQTLTRVLQNIKDSLHSNPRRIRIVYFNSVYADVLNGMDWLEKVQELGSSRDCIWRNKE